MTSPSSDDSPSESIKVIDLFSGAGGLTTGFHRYVPDGQTSSPFESVAAVEFDTAAASTYAANFPTAQVHAGDIADWDPGDFTDAEVILGGPPCQGFSGLGKEDPNDPRNLLWQEYKRVVEKVSPKIFVMENVDRFLRSPQFKDLQNAVKGGELGNYTLRVKILNSADYGVPQARRRVIVIGTRNDLAPVEHPKASHDRHPERWQQQFESDEPDSPPLPWVAVGPAVFDHTKRMTIKGVDLPDRPGDERSPLGLHKPGPFSTRELHIGRTPKPLSLARYRRIPPGGNRNDLRGQFAEIDGEKVYLSTESWDNHNAGSGDVMGRMHYDRPSVTIRTEPHKPEKGRYLHPTEHRPITYYEAALIQGFPEDFKWHGTKIEIARQIGNAVPIGLAKELARVVYQALRG
ncbi:DNA cytosine methyltransferase [Streptomyces sp. NPDC047049]|uniref:DNA cytosine methyltransferase n=1 Tax=Streptomyces sp. NPDC047049 TaxID=3156688 RepID=UPI0033C4ADDE